MKYRRTCLITGVACLFVLFVCTQGAWGSISGSAHDFSGNGWSGGKICEPCHTPHNADSTMTGAPLWNHEVSTATYTLYSSPTMDVTVEQPGPVSKVCLSCHDGTVAVDSFGGQTGSTMITGAANLGTDLSNDHPIGILWQHQTTGPGAASDCNPCHFGPEPRKVVFFGTSYADGLKMECASCHDVHNGAGFPFLTVETMANSQLCFQCHTDK